MYILKFENSALDIKIEDSQLRNFIYNFISIFISNNNTNKLKKLHSEMILSYQVVMDMIKLNITDILTETELKNSINESYINNEINRIINFLNYKNVITVFKNFSIQKEDNTKELKILKNENYIIKISAYKNRNPILKLTFKKNDTLLSNLFLNNSDLTFNNSEESIIKELLNLEKIIKLLLCKELYNLSYFYKKNILSDKLLNFLLDDKMLYRLSILNKLFDNNEIKYFIFNDVDIVNKTIDSIVLDNNQESIKNFNEYNYYYKLNAIKNITNIIRYFKDENCIFKNNKINKEIIHYSNESDVLYLFNSIKYNIGTFNISSILSDNSLAQFNHFYNNEYFNVFVNNLDNETYMSILDRIIKGTRLNYILLKIHKFNIIKMLKLHKQLNLLENA